MLRRLFSGRIIISIHALREEGDDPAVSMFPDSIGFLSTPSARRATRTSLTCAFSLSDFYPRPPRGGRRGDISQRREPLLFLSTPSARRATVFPAVIVDKRYDFYPRPPRGGRLDDSAIGKVCKDFYPRPPRGGRPWSLRFPPVLLRDFYPRPPRGGRRGLLSRRLRRSANFYPRPPRGGRQEAEPCSALVIRFLSTPSARRATAGRAGPGRET